ncbi:hypothetical protein LCGC14_0831750 [marine sediment metagenome]|uniref:Uncharacterized protein n=1 Tax=marine sediment metagenome TaxID=412755 RepID=A0A0F9S0I2_9ZZZZ
MASYSIREKLVRLFNRGAFRLHFFDYHELHIEGCGTFTFNSLIDIAGGETEHESYVAIRDKCLSLFTLIRDGRLTGYYFTPREVLLNWGNL